MTSVIDEEKIKRALENIIKLASSKDIKRHVCVDTIVGELVRNEGSELFPYLIDSIDPDRFGSQTKLLDNYERGLLSDAVTKYSSLRGST